MFDDDIPMLSTLELFVEELVNGPERMTTQTQMSVYVRRWRPDKYEVGPFEEIIIGDSQVSCLTEEVGTAKKFFNDPCKQLVHLKGGHDSKYFMSANCQVLFVSRPNNC